MVGFDSSGRLVGNACAGMSELLLGEDRRRGMGVSCSV